MSDRRRLVPDESHPITISPTGQRVVVTHHGQPVAETDRALTLEEAGYDPVHYVPLADVDPAVLEPSDHTTYCPYKGEASYYSLAVGTDRAENAVWTYQEPYEAVADIEGYAAFYPDRVEIAVG